MLGIGGSAPDGDELAVSEPPPPTLWLMANGRLAGYI